MRALHEMCEWTPARGAIVCWDSMAVVLLHSSSALPGSNPNSSGVPLAVDIFKVLVFVSRCLSLVAPQVR